MGNIFKISANWMVSPVSSSECKVWLEAQVECTKRVWGLQNIAEGYLYSMVLIEFSLKIMFSVINIIVGI